MTNWSLFSLVLVLTNLESLAGSMYDFSYPSSRLSRAARVATGLIRAPSGARVSETSFH